MDEKNKSFEKFIEEEMAKSPEQIQKEVMDDPDYPKLVPKPESYEKLKKRIQNYEAEKEAAEKRLLEQLSEKDREALRLGRELQAKQKEKLEAKPEETAGKVIVYRRRRLRKKPLLAAAATLVLAMGIGMISMGGPRQTLDVAKKMVSGRTRTTVNSEEENMLEIETNAEEEAYQKIKDELGFDPVRMGYLPQGTSFDRITIDQESQSIGLYYTCQDNNLSFIIQKEYTSGKATVDFEDNLLDEYPIMVDGVKVIISEYFIEDTKEVLYTIEFEANETWYCIIGILKKEEMEKIAKNLIFF